MAQEKWFRAIVTCRDTNTRTTIERKSTSKTKFVEQLRSNGYSVKTVVPADDITSDPLLLARYNRWAEDKYHVDGPWSSKYKMRNE